MNICPFSLEGTAEPMGELRQRHTRIALQREKEKAN